MPLCLVHESTFPSLLLLHQQTFFIASSMSEMCQNGSGQPYSITSLARESSVGGTARPRAVPKLTLIVSSKTLDCKIGKSD